MNTSALAMNEARTRTGTGTGHGLEAIDCSKEYRRGHRRGPVLALRDVSVAFARPGIYGLFGNNGAGKSTLFRILTNQAFPTAGSARLDGESVTENPAALADVILLDASAPALNDSVRVFFRLTGASHGGFDWQFAKELAGRFSLDLSSRVSSLSTGYRSVARLIACLCANCDYVLLDEPTQGMDAPHRRLFATALMDAYARRPRTIVIASHLISEIEPLVSRVVIINHGRLVAVDSAEALCDKVYRIEGPEEEVDRYARGHGLTVLSRTSIARSASAIVLAGAGQTDGGPGRDAVRVVPSGSAGPDVAVSRVGLQDLFIALTDYDSRHPGTLGGLVGGANAADGSPDMPASSSVRDSRAVIRRSLAAHFGYVLRSWAISFAIFCACLLAAYLVVDALCAIEGVSGARFSADVPLVIFAAITAAITIRTASFRYLAYGLSRTELAFSLLGLTLLSSLVESCVTVLFMIVPGMLGAQRVWILATVPGLYAIGPRYGMARPVLRSAAQFWILLTVLLVLLIMVKVLIGLFVAISLRLRRIVQMILLAVTVAVLTLLGTAASISAGMRDWITSVLGVALSHGVPADFSAGRLCLTMLVVSLVCGALVWLMLRRWEPADK